MNPFPDFGYGPLYLEKLISDMSEILFVCVNRESKQRFVFWLNPADATRFLVVPVEKKDLELFLTNKCKFEEIVRCNSAIYVCFSKCGFVSIEHIKDKINIHTFEQPIIAVESMNTYIEKLRRD